MRIRSLATPLISAGDSLEELLNTCLPPLQDKDIVAVTSKIISLINGRIVPKNRVPSKRALVCQEADAYLAEPGIGPYQGGLTIKHHILIPAAGIDESNAPDNYYILFPENPFKEAEKIGAYLKGRHNLQHLGVIITDSHTSPLRRGVRGVALAWDGLEPYTDKRGEKDLFGRPLQVTTINVVDALAAAAVFTMGEGAEQTPFALIQEATGVKYTECGVDSEKNKTFFIPLGEDIYQPLFDEEKWIWNKPPAL